MTIDIKFEWKQWGYFYSIINYFDVIFYSKFITIKNCIYNLYKILAFSSRKLIFVRVLRMVYYIKLEQ